MKRRDFVKASSASGIGALMASPNVMAWGNRYVKGANEKVKIGVVGIRGMGQSHMQAFNALPNAEVVALCDVDENLFDERIKKHFTG